MSLAWMTRVWTSPRPKRASYRLLLLALADTANDEGVCWPSVATLGRKCSTSDRRTVLRQLDWLEREGFVRREKRPGRSTVYHLANRPPGKASVSGSVDTPTGDDEPMGTVPPTRDDEPTPGEVAAGPPVGDAPPTPPVAARPPEPAGEPSPNPQHQQPSGAPGRTREATPLRMLMPAGLPAASGSADGDATEDAATLLVRRGVDPPVAEALAAEHGAEAVERAARLYDARRRGPKPPSGAGWLVAALRHGYANKPAPAAEPAPLLSHGEMLRWCEANGGLHRTSEFTPVPQPDGPPRFRRPLS